MTWKPLRNGTGGSEQAAPHQWWFRVSHERPNRYGPVQVAVMDYFGGTHPTSPFLPFRGTWPSGQVGLGIAVQMNPEEEDHLLLILGVTR